MNANIPTNCQGECPLYDHCAQNSNTFGRIKTDLTNKVGQQAVDMLKAKARFTSEATHYSARKAKKMTDEFMKSQADQRAHLERGRRALGWVSYRVDAYNEFGNQVGRKGCTGPEIVNIPDSDQAKIECHADIPDELKQTIEEMQATNNKRALFYMAEVESPEAIDKHYFEGDYGL